MRMEPLSPALGAEVTDINLAATEAAGWAEIRAALAEHLVLVFRDQALSPADLLAVAGRFGDAEPSTPDVALPGHPFVREVRKEPSEKANFGGFWHNDGSARARPPRFTFLYGLVTPEGGDTLFASQIRAFDCLDPALRAEVEPLVGCFGAPGDDLGRVVRHPIVQAGEDGRRYLFVSATHLRGFEGMSEAESAPLRERLAADAIRPEHRARLVWRPGTLAIWNNRATQHCAVNDYAGRLRVMHRLLVP